MGGFTVSFVLGWVGDWGRWDGVLMERWLTVEYYSRINIGFNTNYTQKYMFRTVENAFEAKFTEENIFFNNLFRTSWEDKMLKIISVFQKQIFNLFTFI